MIMNAQDKPDTKLEGRVFFDPYLPEALRQAHEYAAEDGFVVSMPQLLRARANAGYRNEIWNFPLITTHSEENVATTDQGTHVVVVVHGGGIFGSPERFKTLYHSNVSRHSETGFTGLFAAKLAPDEARNIIKGHLPNGDEIPIYSYDELRKGIADLPCRYGIVIDFDTAKMALTGNVAFDDLKEDALMIARAGGPDAAATYLERAKSRNNSEVMGSWHNFKEIDPDQSQSRVLFLGGSEGGATTEVYRDLSSKEQQYVGIWGTHYRSPIEAEYGIRGDTSMINTARYIAVAPHNASTSLRHLKF